MAALTVAAGAVSMAMAAPAQADDGASTAERFVHGNQAGSGIAFGDNLCAAPRYWEGPGNADVANKMVDYDAAGSDACIAPWHWNGPLNVPTGNIAYDYKARN